MRIDPWLHETTVISPKFSRVYLLVRVLTIGAEPIEKEGTLYAGNLLRSEVREGSDFILFLRSRRKESCMSVGCVQRERSEFNWRDAVEAIPNRSGTPCPRLSLSS